MKLDIIKTFDDNKLKWNKDYNEYELTLEAIKNLVGDSFSDDTVAMQRSRLTSMNVYSFIFNRGHTYNKKYSEFIINRTKQGRELIFKALSWQIIADAQNGYNDITNQSAIDFNSGHSIRREIIRSNRVTTNVEDLLNNSQSHLCGYNLLAQRQYYLPQIDEILNNESN